jgi:hypothetical protein
MRRLHKALLVLEVLVCFGPMCMMLALGALLIPIQLVALVDEPPLWEGPVEVIGSVLCGAVGLATLVYVLGKLVDVPNQNIARPLLVLAGALIGVVPLIDVVTSPELVWRILGAMPIAAGLHVLFLARKMLFAARRKS